MAAELALAVARIIGNERSYIQMARALRQQPGTTVAQTIANARRHLARSQHGTQHSEVAILNELQVIGDDFAHEELDHATRAFGQWLERLPPQWYSKGGAAVLAEVSCKLVENGYARSEYLLLGLHTITEGLKA
jgi:hypothetical protein